MIISPKKRNALLKLANTMARTPNNLEDGEFSVDALPQTESDGSITLDPSTLLGRWDEWETSIPTDLRSWNVDKEPIESEDFRENYKILHYKIVDGFEVKWS